MRSVLALLICGSTGLMAADTSKFTTPEPDNIPKDLRAASPDDETYPFPQDLEKAKKLRTEATKWYYSQIVTPFETRAGAKAAWAGKARAALQSVADYFDQGAFYAKRSVLLDLRAVSLGEAMKAGCDDPVVKFFNVGALKFDKPEAKLQALKECGDAVEEVKATPFVRFHAAFYCGAESGKIGKANPQFRREAKDYFVKALKILGEVVKDPHPAAQHAVHVWGGLVLKEYRSNGLGRENGWLDFQEILTDAKRPTATIKAIEGQFLIDHAWDARGNDLGPRVTEEGSKLFHERLRDAGTALEAAWNADGECSRAASGMIKVCMGRALPRDEMETWFQRAMKANPDNQWACAAKMSYLFPKWRGSQPDAMTFGRQCLRSKNFQSGIPYILVETHKEFCRGSMQTYVAKNPTAWADLREVFELWLQEWPSDRDLRSEYAVLCASMKQWEAAQIHVQALKNRPAVSVFPTRKEFDAFQADIEKNLMK